MRTGMPMLGKGSARGYPRCGRTSLSPIGIHRAFLPWALLHRAAFMSQWPWGCSVPGLVLGQHRTALADKCMIVSETQNLFWVCLEDNRG